MRRAFDGGTLGLFDKVKFAVMDNADLVSGMIAKWQPAGCKTEKDYEKSLYAHLHEHAGDVQVTKQYAKGRIKADIVVNGKVILELKNNLDSTAKLQRLVGQIEEYREWEGDVIVLLTGSTEANIKKDLDKRIAEFNNREDFNPLDILQFRKRFQVIQK